MSLTVDSISNGSIMTQLQNMQKQMRVLSEQQSNMQASALGVSDNTPKVDAQQNVEITDSTKSADDSVGEFEALLKNAFEQVNILQNESSSMQSRFDVGDRSITLADVMLASQKSSISFEATMQVRNKMVDAYKTIMQMQI